MVKIVQIVTAQKSLNTFLFFIYLLTLVFYWSLLIPFFTENSSLYVFSSAIFIIMTIMFFLQVTSKHQFPKKSLRFLTIFLFLIIGHFLFSKTDILQAFNLFFLFFLYLLLPQVDFDASKLYSWVLYGFIIMSIICLPAVLIGIVSNEEYTGFAGIFESANSIGPLGGCALLCLILKFRNLKIVNNRCYYLSFVYIIVVIYSSHQRSSILMLICWMAVYYLLTWSKNKKVIFLGFIISLMLIGSYMVISEVIQERDNSGIQLFGKEASSRGRSVQIYYAISSFDLSPWGAGRGVVNKAVVDETRYAVHNTFVASLLEYGYLIFFFYLYYLYYLFKRSDIIPASFILSYHVILFFEPDNFFSNRLVTFIAFSIVLVSKKMPQLAANN